MKLDKTQWFTLIVLVLSGLGLGLLLGAPFAGLYTGGGLVKQYAGLAYGNNASFTIAAIIIGAVLFGIQAVIALNELLPKRIFKQNLMMLALLLAFGTLGVVIAGGINFGAWALGKNWWFEGGFVMGLLASAANAVIILFFIKPPKLDFH